MTAAAGIRLSETTSPGPRMTDPGEPGEPNGVVIVTTVATFIAASEPPPAREPGEVERALAASYERYAGRLAEIEALRRGGTRGV